MTIKIENCPGCKKPIPVGATMCQCGWHRYADKQPIARQSLAECKRQADLVATLKANYDSARRDWMDFCNEFNTGATNDRRKWMRLNDRMGDACAAYERAKLKLEWLQRQRDWKPDAKAG